jgi:hypothetical protein
MVTTPSHPTLHRLNRLITTFLAQMRHRPDPDENTASVKESDTHDQSNDRTDSTLTQVAAEPTIKQAALTHQTLEPALLPVTTAPNDGRTKDTFGSEQELQGQRSDKSAVKYVKGSVLRCKKAYLIINPRAGHNLTRIADVLAVLSAAGWKQYAGHLSF